MATVGYCSNYGPCGTANAKSTVELKLNLDHCPDCGLTLHPIADLEPLLVASSANREGAQGVRFATPSGPPDAAATLLSPPAAPRSPRTEHFSDPATVPAPAPAAEAPPPAAAVSPPHAAAHDPPPAAVEPPSAPAEESPAAVEPPSAAAEESPPARRPSRLLITSVAAAGALALAAGVAWTVFPSRPAAAAVAFRLCGSDALGGRLGFDLVQGFLTRAGGSALEVTPFDGTGEATVAADVKGNPTRVAITAAGSSAAYAQIAAGTCQAAIAGRPPTAAELAKIRARYPAAPGGFARPVARDGVVVVVNPANHINHLSLDAVRRAFTGAAANWSALGGAQLPIAVVAPDEGSDVAAVFAARALRSDRITANAARKPTLRAVASAVAHDANAIGLVTFSDSSPAKVVALETPNHRIVPPSVLTIGTSYPLSIEFGLYTPARGDNADADRFVAYLASDDAQNAIGNAGFVPASP